MKKRTPDDLNLFDYEDNLLHALSESNSAYIKFSAPYIELPPCPIGNEKIEFKVGDLVADARRSFYKEPMVWKILDVYKRNGFVSYMCQIELTPELVKKKFPATKRILWQSNVDLVKRSIQSKKSEPRKAATRESRCQFCGNVTKTSSEGLAVKHQYVQNEGAFPSRCPGSGLPPTTIVRNLSRR